MRLFGTLALVLEQYPTANWCLRIDLLLKRCRQTETRTSAAPLISEAAELLKLPHDWHSVALSS